MNTKKINIGIWYVLLALFLVITIMHPRIHFGLILIICFTQCISMTFSKKVIAKKLFWKKTIEGIVSIFILCSMSKILNVFCPYHAAYEYKNDIQNLKIENPQIYSHFPDTIPDSAMDIKWVCLPNFLQGNGYEALFFYADDSYIEEIYDTYISMTAIYKYSDENYTWTNNEGKSIVSFPRINEISDKDKENVCVIIMTDNGNSDYSHKSGLYINKVDGYVCFFAD